MTRRFTTLLGREVRSYFHSPIAYIVLVFFLLVSGFNFVAGVSLLNRAPSEVTVLEAFFNTVLFWFGYVLVFPLLTMRSFAEEFKMGTIETLMTAPVRTGEVLMAKFLGALFFYVILWLPSVLYFWLFNELTGEASADSWGAYLGSYGLLLFMGCFYLAIGLLASALTPNQIVAAVVSFCAITLVFFAGLLSFFVLSVSPAIRSITGYFSAIEHMRDFSQGLIDSRPIVFYTSMTAFTLYLTYHVLLFRKWKS